MIKGRIKDDKGMSWVFSTLACPASFDERGDAQSEQHRWLVRRRPVWLLRSDHQQDGDPYRIHQLQRRCFVDTYRVPQVMSDSEAGCVQTVWKENQQKLKWDLVGRYLHGLSAEGWRLEVNSSWRVCRQTCVYHFFWRHVSLPFFAILFPDLVQNPP